MLSHLNQEQRQKDRDGIVAGRRGRVRRPLGGGSYVDSHQTPWNCRIIPLMNRIIVAIIPSLTDNSVSRRVASPTVDANNSTAWPRVLPPMGESGYLINHAV